MDERLERLFELLRDSVRTARLPEQDELVEFIDALEEIDDLEEILEAYLEGGA